MHPGCSNEESQRITEGANKRIPGTQMVLHRREVRGTALGGIVQVQKCEDQLFPPYQEGKIAILMMFENGRGKGKYLL